MGESREEGEKWENAVTELLRGRGAETVLPTFCCAWVDTWPRRDAGGGHRISTSPVTLRCVKGQIETDETHLQ